VEFTLLFAVLTGAASCWVALRLTRPAGEWGRSGGAYDLLVSSAAVGLVAGRLTAMVDAGINPLTNLGLIPLVRAGVETQVAAPVALLVLGWRVRHQLPSALDAFAPAALAGLAGWHAGCVWRGACLGAASELPWAYPLPGSDITRHPVELYTAVLVVAAAVVIARVHRGWMASGLAVAAAAGARLLTESLRPSLDGGPGAFYVAAVVVGLAVAGYGLVRAGINPSLHS
jgi:prolipoprotein diacylglyceryltransferase